MRGREEDENDGDREEERERKTKKEGGEEVEGQEREYRAQLHSFTFPGRHESHLKGPNLTRSRRVR